MKTCRGRFHVTWRHFYIWFDQATEKLFRATGMPLVVPDASAPNGIRAIEIPEDAIRRVVD